MAAARHITIFFEIRLRLEHSDLIRSKLEMRLTRRDAALEKRDGLNAGFVRGKKGTDINYIPTYNLDAVEVYADVLNVLNDVPFPLLKQIKACAEQPLSYLKALLVMGVYESIQDDAGTSTNPASGSTSFAGGLTEQFIVAPSVPYVGDAGATVKDVTPTDEIVTVEWDDVLAGTASNPAASDVHASSLSTLVIPTSRPFK
ncbi:hypothetical protein Tco_0046679 [Tanacetum coccineum]